MEICDNLRKSVLKKPHSSSKNKERKVTFCGTVKLFVNEPNLNKKDCTVDRQLDCVEISIVDKSSSEHTVPKNEDCTANDFLVHKVIYNDELEQDESCDTDTISEEADESSILFDVSNEDEGLQFVVHKVTDHEDDLIQQELELERTNSEINESLVGQLSELSIENILTHDKIIAFIDQKSLGLASLLRKRAKLSEVNSVSVSKNSVEVDTLNISSEKDSELVLSPPLQELGLDKIVKAQSDNVLSELDISPLNSIQETDSESDVSSEGTMIMMTTEESEKNEQHIRESFLKYQSLINQKFQTKDSVPVLEFKDLCDENDTKSVESSHDSSFSSDTEVQNSCKEMPFNNVETEASNTFPDQNYFVEPSCCSEGKTDCDLSKKGRSTSLCDSTSINYDSHFSHMNSWKSRRESFDSVKPSSCWDKSLESVEIPKDVRDWKIITSDKSSKENFEKELHTLETSNSDVEHLTPDSCYPEPFQSINESTCTFKLDELENFVHASSERVQRIRKRYSEKPKNKVGLSSLRGIRPRFCTTAEILQMLEKKNQPPFITFQARNHVSWPCNEPVNHPNMNIQSNEQLSRMFGCPIMPGDFSLQSSFSSNISDSSSSTCDHDSVSSCPSLFFHERGMPEGASPPRSLSNDTIEQYSNEESPSSIVYFSMKV